MSQTLSSNALDYTFLVRGKKVKITLGAGVRGDTDVQRKVRA